MIAPAHAATNAPVGLVCALSGKTRLERGVSREAICARFGKELSAALHAPVSQLASVPSGRSARWVKAELKLLPHGGIEAVLVSHLGGPTRRHPAIALRVMDKPLGLREIDRLARLAAAGIAKAGRETE